MSPDGCGALGDALVLEDVEDRETGGRGGGGAGEGGEVLVVAGKALSDFPAGDEGADRVASPHRLAERDEVGGDAGGGKAPEGGADPPEANLDLVGEEKGACAVGAVDQAGDEVGGGVEDAFAGEAEVGQDQGGLVAMVRETGDRRGYPFGSGLAVDAAGTAAGRGEGGDVVGVVAGGPFVGAQIGHPLVCPVVGALR